MKEKVWVKPKELEETFFPVECRSLSWESEEESPGNIFFPSSNKWIECDEWVAIVDMAHNHVFAPVSTEYVLYTHKETYDLGLALTKLILLNDKTNNEVEFLKFYTTMYGSQVSYRFSTTYHSNQPEAHGGWIPIIEVGNSYNKTRALECNIGLYLRDYEFEVLFPTFKTEAKSHHMDSTEKMREKLMYHFHTQLDIIKDYIVSYYRMLDDLKNIDIASTEMLPVFCKVQKISVSTTSSKKELADKEGLLDFVSERITHYGIKHGYNAYALFLVMNDYVKNKLKFGFNKIQKSFNLGKWVDELTSEAMDKKFSLYDYIGKDASETAAWYTKLQNKKLKQNCKIVDE